MQVILKQQAAIGQQPSICHLELTKLHDTGQIGTDIQMKIGHYEYAENGQVFIVTGIFRLNSEELQKHIKSVIG